MKDIVQERVVDSWVILRRVPSKEAIVAFVVTDMMFVITELWVLEVACDRNREK